MMLDFKLNVVDVEPVYSGAPGIRDGYFTVSIEEYTNQYNLSFMPVLAFIAKNDKKLMEYVEKNHNLDDPNTKVSDVIRDLVEIGIPMTDVVQKYFDFMVDNMSRELKMLSLLSSFFSTDKGYGEDLD